MGTDIHLHVERFDGQEWSRVHGEWTVERNYRLFTALAGVRYWDHGGSVSPISPPRGLPNDVSAEVAVHASHHPEDHYSHSWLRLSEITEYDWSSVTGSEPDHLDGRWLLTVLAMVRIAGGDLDTVRAVFWFNE